MGKMLAIMDVSPEGVEVNLEELKESIKKTIESFEAELGEIKEEELAFGLKKLKVVIITNEEENLDNLTDKVKSIDGIKSAEVVDVRRAIG
jgi:translation elongation factor aEF-1 beta